MKKKQQWIKYIISFCFFYESANIFVGKFLRYEKKKFTVETIWDYRVYANFVESDEIHRVYDFFNSDRNEFYSSDPRQGCQIGHLVAKFVNLATAKNNRLNGNLAIFGFMLYFYFIS